MATISVAIAVRDEVEDWRKKQGDIIAIKPGGWQWGTGEVSDLLILEMALPPNITIEMCLALVSRYFSNGVLEWDGAATVLAKRRFRVTWNTLKTIISQAGINVDWARVEDVTIAYQPLSPQDVAPGGTSVSLDPTKLVFDKYENRLIRALDFSTLIAG